VDPRAGEESRQITLERAAGSRRDLTLCNICIEARVPTPIPNRPSWKKCPSHHRHEQKQGAIQGVTVKVLEQQKKGSDAVAVTDAGNLE